MPAVPSPSPSTPPPGDGRSSSVGVSAPSAAPSPAQPAGGGPTGVRAAAFFDLDKTLVAGSSGFYWARAAASHGLISRRRLAADGWENLKFRMRGSTDDSTRRVWDRVGAFIAGQRVRDFERLTPRVLAGVLPRLYPEMLALAWEHQDEGRPIYIVTASTQDTAEMIAHVLAFDGGVGAPLEVRDGRYTGRLAGPMTYREGKVEALRQLAERDGLDLAASWAYSDSESDLPMLRAVGHPVAVNPDRELARVAEQEGWEIVRLERIASHLKTAAALVAVGALGGLGRAVTAGRPPGGIGRRRG